MAVQSNLKNMALVLTLTCLFCSAILGGAYALTKDPIDKAAEAKTAKAIGAVLPEFDATSYETVSVDGKDFNYYLAKKGSETVGYAVERGAEDNQRFQGMNNYAVFWTSDSDGDYGLYRYIYVQQNDVMLAKGDKTSFRASVRCIKD